MALVKSHKWLFLPFYPKFHYQYFCIAISRQSIFIGLHDFKNKLILSTYRVKHIQDCGKTVGSAVVELFKARVSLVGILYHSQREIRLEVFPRGSYYCPCYFQQSFRQIDRQRHSKCPRDQKNKHRPSNLVGEICTSLPKVI